jgi:hypothetical protein
VNCTHCLLVFLLVGFIPGFHSPSSWVSSPSLWVSFPSSWVSFPSSWVSFPCSWVSFPSLFSWVSFPPSCLWAVAAISQSCHSSTIVFFFSPHIPHSSTIMTSPLEDSSNIRISALSNQAVPGSAFSNNPFLTSTPVTPAPRNARDVPPHQVVRTKASKFPSAFDQAYSYILPPDFGDADPSSPSSSSSSESESLPSTPMRSPARQPLLWPGVPDPKRAIKEKTMAGVPTWPADLRLSIGANNWLEWSRHLLVALSMGQLDVYPLGMLARPRQETDRASHDNWQGNDRMVLGYMRSHMFPSEA